MLRLAMILPFVLACADEGRALSAEERSLVGCWERDSRPDRTLFRFHDDGEVSQQVLPAGTTYRGTFSLEGDQLTLDFGEEPPTYTIMLTADELALGSLGVFARVACEG